ncbi:MAG: right-handed parallel beta-helix repeat-containing protein [Nitrospirales bacterium]
MKQFLCKPSWVFLLFQVLCLAQFSVSFSAPLDSPRVTLPPEQAKWTVAVDGSGHYISIQEAIDAAQSGDTIWIKAGTYAEDVTVHSKEGLKIIGEKMDLVVLSGLKRVGTLHLGKWPYGAMNVEIHNLTVNQHGGLGLGIFNGSGLLLKRIHVKGMVFGQEVEDVRLEDCIIGGSETSGVAFANSKATLIRNFIHDNDHGVAIGGTSEVLLKQNVITRSLFEGIMVNDTANVTAIQNTIVRNGGGMAFHDTTKGEAHGNILMMSQTGFLLSPKSQTTLSFNDLFANKVNYQQEGVSGSVPTGRKGENDVNVPPDFVNAEKDDFRLSANTNLRDLGTFPYLGALPPLNAVP